tara:strand:+ start:3090 stop:3431 length:342 start_codon:yes stop_codon:yes gene_type:complete
MAKATKHDTGKTRYDLLPPEALEQVADVFTLGAKKYGGRNWEGGIEYGRVFGALMRHAWAWWRGETFDAKDGQHHLASVAFCALALLQYECVGPKNDDRPERKENALQIDKDI